MHQLTGIFIFSLLSLPLFSQTIIEGKSFPNTLNTEKGTLVLNGGGVREKLWIDVYVAALYLTSRSNNAAQIIQADQPMAVRMHIVSGMVNSENMSEAVHEGFEKSTNRNTAPLKDKIEAFIQVFKEPIKVDDVFLIVYLPGEGIKIYKNEMYKAVIQGLDFKKALFGIWLGDTPVSTGLKKGMLGG
ncbi:MAG TPA: chalcone isomerase family protein [Chitinophagales bacterium]|nr:chalcone isomerase family protein [Chitinophagales bacterium]